MSKTKKLIAAGATLVVLAAGGVGVALATGESGEGDETVTGPAANRATEAALSITGGGTANSVERDDENGATWEVEVTREDGQTVDVRLDENMNKVVVEGDSEDTADSEDPSDD
ncbi:hypothetical protein HJD18_09325 [Thermoleophilia bacterium SCSIO 60948]|nr:hypothetical protein HJD18_09325 [Thermoleophilia bacterium SCSIO 60948]